MKYWLFTFFALLISTRTVSQNLNEIYKKSIDAFEDKKFDDFQNLNLKALEIHPSHPTLLYNLALSYALLKDYKSAFNRFSYLLSWNSNLDIEKDADLVGFLSSKNYKDLLILKKEMFSKVEIESSMFLSLSNKIHIEDFVINGDYIYYSDLHNGMVSKYNFRRNYLESKAYFSSSPLAVAQDANEEFIWISLSMIENYKGYKKIRKNEASLVKIRTEDMKQVKEIEIPDEAVIGSMIFYKKKLYVTSSHKPQLFIINTEDGIVEDIININEAFNLQGVSIDEKNEFLYVADYIKGIAKINLKDFSDRVWLGNSTNFLLKGIDGLAFINSHTLFAVQNNSNPKRVIKITHDSKLVTNVEIIDNAIETEGEPTNIKLTKKGLMYLSNSQWPFYDKNSKADYGAWVDQEIRLINNVKY